MSDLLSGAEDNKITVLYPILVTLFPFSPSHLIFITDVLHFISVADIKLQLLKHKLVSGQLLSSDTESCGSA